MSNYPKEIEDINKIIYDAKKTKKLILEKEMKMTFKEKTIIDFYSIPIFTYLLLTSMITSISLTFLYLDILNNIKDIKEFNTLSYINYLIINHLIIGIILFFLIFISGLFFVGIYGYGYHIEKTIKEENKKE